MRKVFLTVGTLASTALSMGFSANAFAAAASYYPMPSVDARRGEHPYEERKEALERRRELRERNRSRGYGYLSLTDIYTSPARTENLQLHPFFRNQAAVGSTVYNPYSLNRNPVYDPAVYTYPRHPSTYCLNYRFERYGYRTAPMNYECAE